MNSVSFFKREHQSVTSTSSRTTHCSKLFSVKPIRSRQSLIERCKSESIVKPSISLHSIKLDNLRSLMTLIIFIYCLLYALLVTEIVRKKSHRQKLKRRKRQKLRPTKVIGTCKSSVHCTTRKQLTRRSSESDILKVSRTA